MEKKFLYTFIILAGVLLNCSPKSSLKTKDKRGVASVDLGAYAGAPAAGCFSADTCGTVEERACSGAYAIASGSCNPAPTDPAGRDRCKADADSCSAACGPVAATNASWTDGARWCAAAYAAMGGSAVRASANPAGSCTDFEGRITDSPDGILPADLNQCSADCAAASEAETDPTRKASLAATGQRCTTMASATPALSERDALTTAGAEDGAKATDAVGGDGSGEDAGGTDQAGTDGGASDATSETGTPNYYAQQGLLQGMAMAPTVGTDLGQYAAVNFATGATADNSLYQRAAADVAAASQTGGFNPGTTNFPRELIRGEMDHLKPSSAGGGAPGGAGATPFPGGGGGGGSPMGMGAARGGGPGGGGGGGGRTTIAGAQLGKVGQNAFYASGGGSAAGQGRNMAAAAAAKTVTPKYKKKENDSSVALQRMFGNGHGRYNIQGNVKPISSYHAVGCLDTVFCSMEDFFGRVERYPNSDINPNSYNTPSK